MTDQTPQTEPQGFDRSDIMQAVRENRERFRNLGIVLIVLGILMIFFPIVSSIVTKVTIGWVFLISGGFMLYHAFQAKGWRSGLSSGLIGVLQIAIGVYLAFFPLTGLIGLTSLMAVLFLIQGGFELYISVQHRPEKGWGWLAANGVVTTLLGILLILGLPGTALWALGLIVGINILSSGIAFFTLSRQAAGPQT